MSAVSLVLNTTNNQTVTVVYGDNDAVTLRVAKDGHNRAVAKLDSAAAAALAAFLVGDTSAAIDALARPIT